MGNGKCRFGGCGDPLCKTCGGGQRKSEKGVRTVSLETIDTWETNIPFPSSLRFEDARRAFERPMVMPWGNCGNPDCLICNKGRDDVREKKEAMIERTLKEDLSSSPPEFIRNFISGTIVEVIGGGGGGGGITNPVFTFTVPGGGDSQSGEAASAESAAEREARGKVERFLLKTKHATDWDDVVGNAAAKAALLEAIELPIKHADLHAHYGMTPPKGVLLYGPPGCGKTMFGKAAAAALARLHGADVPLLKINGPEIQSPFIGITEGMIREIFAYARLYAERTKRSLVIFIDEADAILPPRDGRGGRRAASWEESQVATFLTEMDGLETSGAFVVLATNRPHAIDEAVLRDGRCDRKIKVERPDRDASFEILARALSGTPNDGELELSDLAAIAADAIFDPGLRLARIHHDGGLDFLTLGNIVNGAMLNGIVAQAKASAFRRDLAAGDGSRSGIGRADLETAIASVFAQNIRLDHLSAVADFAETHDLTVSKIEPERIAA